MEMWLWDGPWYGRRRKSLARFPGQTWNQRNTREVSSRCKIGGIGGGEAGEGRMDDFFSEEEEEEEEEEGEEEEREERRLLGGRARLRIVEERRGGKGKKKDDDGRRRKRDGRERMEMTCGA